MLITKRMSFLILQIYAHDTTNKSFSKLIKTLSNFLNQNFPTKLYRKKFHFLKTLSLSKKKNTNKNQLSTVTLTIGISRIGILLKKNLLGSNKSPGDLLAIVAHAGIDAISIEIDLGEFCSAQVHHFPTRNL